MKKRYTDALTITFTAAALFALALFGCEQAAGSDGGDTPEQSPVINVLPGNQCISVSWSNFTGTEVLAGTGDEMPDSSEGTVEINGNSAVISGLENNTAYNVWVVGPADEYIKTSEKAVPVNVSIPAGKFAGSSFIYELNGATYTKYRNNGFNAPSGIVYTGTIVFADGSGAIIIKASEGAYRAVKVTYENKLYKVKEATETPEIPDDKNGMVTASFGEADTANIVVGKLVMFDSNGGDTEASPAAITVETDKTAGKLPIPPEKTNFQFSGWKKADGSAFTAETVIDSNMTVYAQWTAEAGGTKTFANMDDMKYFLENFYGENSAANPVEIVLTSAVSVNDLKTDNDSLGALFDALDGKYVTLDMSAVTGTEIMDNVAAMGSIRADEDKLVSVKLPASLKKAGNYSFTGCTSLESVEFPDTLTDLGKGAFSGCVSLSAAALPFGVTEILESTFEGCASLDFDAAFFANIEKIGASAFKGSGITSLTLSNTVKELGGMYIFQDCKNLETVDLSVLNSSITGFPQYLFANCSKLKNLTLPPDGLTGIGHYTFQNCTELESVTLPTSLTHIGTSTFQGCTKIETITLPPNLTYTGNTVVTSGSAFKNCTGLKTVIWESLNQDCTINVGTFNGCVALETFIVPEKVTMIAPGATAALGAFGGCTSLTSVTLPATLTRLGNNAFNGCANLTEIIILKPSSNGVITLSNVNAFTGTPFASAGNDAHIYVPDEASVTAYKAANNWKTDAISSYISLKPTE